MPISTNPSDDAEQILADAVDQTGALARRARAEGFDSLAYILDMARTEAEKQWRFLPGGKWLKN